MGGDHAQPEFVFHLLGQMARLRFEHLGSEMLQDGDLRTNRFDDRPGAVEGEMVDLGLVAEAQNVNNQHVGLVSCVVFGQPIEKAAARQVGNVQPAIRVMHAVGLHRVQMRHRRPQFDVVDRVWPGRWLEPYDRTGVALRVREHDGPVFERIGRRENLPATAKTARRHGLDQRVDVAGMVEMFVRKNDRIEFARIAGWNVRERPY